MQRTALQSRRRARSRTRTAASRRKLTTLPIGILAALAVIFAVGLGVLLVVRSTGATSATGKEHAVGSASAPVVVDEWSDFE